MQLEQSRGESYLPALATVHALAECGHRFISTTGLSLSVADLPLLAAAALQTVTDTLLCHANLGLLDVLLLVLDLEPALTLALELVVGHYHELFRADRPIHNPNAELLVGLVLQVGKQRSDLLLVVGCLPLELRESGLLDGNGPRDHARFGFRGAVSQSIVDEANARVARVGAGALDVHSVGIELALLGVALERLLGVSVRSRRGCWSDGGRRRGSRRRGAYLALRLLLLLDELLPLAYQLGCCAGDLLVRIRAQLSYKDTCAGSLYI